MTDTEERLAAAARALVAARRGPRPTDLPAGLVPRTADEAYRVQDLVLGGAPIAGWKILATAAPGSYSCAALSEAVRIADGGPLDRGDRGPELEVEIAIAIAADLPPRKAGYDRIEVLAALGQAHAALELLESRFAHRKQVAPLSGLADAQSNGAFAVGSGAAGWQEMDLAALDLSLSADGQEIARARGGATAAQVTDALVWLANHASARGTGLRAGQFVITGARIGPIPVPAAARISAEVPGIGTVSLRPV
jgi:2-keto-4-pentenoate hydratase